AQNLLLHVDRQVSVVLEDADLALLLEADATGRGVCDTAAFELQPRVHDVDLAREHAGADRIDTHDRSADKLLNQVYVVNHQIEHDAHIAAALLERREPMRLDEARCFELPHCGDDGRIEALQVPDLQHATTSLRGRDQLLRFRDGGCDRFLDEHMNAVLEQLAADPMMQWRGHSQAHCVHSPD